MRTRGEHHENEGSRWMRIYIIIATPEKSKAILRGNEEILGQIELIIIDEGHLIGAEYLWNTKLRL